jgi:tetratricopeptide (TPR) repeat protein
MPAYEHRAYVSLAGAAVCLAATARGAGGRAAGTHRAERMPLGSARSQRAVPSRNLRFVIISVVVVALAQSTSARLPVFRDAFSYWTDAARDPVFGPLANVNLGQLHERAGRLADARREYLAALHRDPNTPKAHNNLGVVLMALGEPALAAKHFREETARHPWNADAWFNLGLAAETNGDAAEARRYYARALEANPAYAPARERLQTSAPNSQLPTSKSQLGGSNPKRHR